MQIGVRRELVEPTEQIRAVGSAVVVDSSPKSVARSRGPGRRRRPKGRSEAQRLEAGEHVARLATERLLGYSLVTKAVFAAQREGVRSLVLAGGVAANRELRESSRVAAEAVGIRLVVPPFKACTDNAAMIAYAGAQRLLRGENDAGALTMSPNTALPRMTRKGRGVRREA